MRLTVSFAVVVTLLLMAVTLLLMAVTLAVTLLLMAARACGKTFSGEVGGSWWGQWDVFVCVVLGCVLRDMAVSLPTTEVKQAILRVSCQVPISEDGDHLIGDLELFRNGAVEHLEGCVHGGTECTNASVSDDDKTKVISKV